MNFHELEKQGKTVIYKDSKTELNGTDWEFWGERKTKNEHVFVYRKIVTIDEAMEYQLENDILN